jgi:hypothetical protein
MQRYVAEALNDQTWIADIHGVPTLQEIIEFVLLWATVRNQEPLTDVEDKFVWHLTTMENTQQPLPMVHFSKGQLKWIMQRRCGKIGHPSRRSCFASWHFKTVAGLLIDWQREDWKH